MSSMDFASASERIASASANGRIASAFANGRIARAFAGGHKAFIPFVTCGDPDLETTASIVRMFAENGADLIELGIPFSDPVAEGPVIHAASMRALAAGTTVDGIFEMVAELRKTVEVPLVFMTYANVVFARGIDAFAARCADVGIDGIIIPDLPFEEKGEFEPALRRFGIDLISMVSPASGDDRIAMIAREANGFIYVVSSYGVTGVREHITSDIKRMVRVVRENSAVPCAIGFGISNAKQAAEMAKLADGVIMGSAIMRIVAENCSLGTGVVLSYLSSFVRFCIFSILCGEEHTNETGPDFDHRSR